MEKFKHSLFQYMCFLNHKYHDVQWLPGAEYALWNAMKTGRFGGYLIESREKWRLRYLYVLSGFTWFNLPDASDFVQPISFREWRTLKLLRPAVALVPVREGYR